ncbi:ATP-binding protein [Arthrobacter sp. AZCC_0090]|uniref:ATP-binding protein n=1 Tax=Arthrobacter sp. AZCC_0090 TaxID=2735881 RepID=UPI0017BA3834|nr:ATP-binding protein [Arthrobacter sp. AZCC_0090]MBB6405090.1 DNA transposition AAA+ family ATPase [Arthrobacter sp. AZCC_0090]
MGVILIGAPSIEKRLARYPQLYSRIGFAHHYWTLSTEELTFVLANRRQELGLTIDPQDFTDAEAIAAVARITNGNFRLIQRLFTQITRIRDINQLNGVTKEVVEAARETLLIGT